MLELRPYQAELIDNIRASIRSGHRSICAVLGCGGGKSVIAAEIARLSNSRGNRVLFLVHRAELCEQIDATFRAACVDMDRTRICMVQTLARRPERTDKPQLIITDEAHHSTASSYRKIYDAFPEAVRVGFTATPVRLGEGGLGAVFDDLIDSVSTSWLIENHYLAPYKYYSYKLADTAGLHTRAGEYVQAEVSGLMEKTKIYGDTLACWQKFAAGKKTIVYCASIKASEETARVFTTAGVRAVHLDGTTPKDRRAAAVNAFRRGEIDVLCNVDLFGEGFDVPDCECVILLRPTKSLTLHVQQSMRSMRYRAGKTALILDHVGNVFEHGLPDDVRTWSLESKKRGERGRIHVRECPMCFSVMPAPAAVCTECGYIWTKEERAALETDAAAEIIEINSAEVRRRQLKEMPFDSYKRMKTFEELHEFGAARGYKFLWSLRKCRELGIPIPPKYEFMVRRFIG